MIRLSIINQSIMYYKAVVVDIDGTITFRDRSLDCKAVAALRSLHIPVVVATGNVLCVAETVALLLGTGTNVIAENGGVVGCGRIESDTSHLRECEEAFKILRHHFSLTRLDEDTRITEIALARNFDMNQARKFIPPDLQVDVVDTGYAIHIKSKKINKGKGLSTVAEIMGVALQDFIAIGDSPNDIEMLQVSGFGIAVGNAHPDLKKVARMVTKGEHGSGIAEALMELRKRKEIR